MSKGINKFIGIGNCCADPEVRHISNGGAVTNISIACNDSYKDKNTGQIIDKTEFVRVVFFNRLAEIVGEYVRKGSKLYIEGSLRTRKWKAQDGSDRYTTEIVASEMQMLDSRNGAEGQGQGGGYQSAPAFGQTSAGGSGQQQATAAPDLDDEIPF